MKRLLLFACFFASPAYTAVCPDGLSRASDSARCPTHLFAEGVSSITQTSASIDGENDINGVGSTRYIYVSASAYPPGCSAANYTHANLTSPDPALAAAARLGKANCSRHDLIKSGSGATAHTSETLVYAGAYLKVVSGLPSGTALYGHSQAHGGGCDPYPGLNNCTNTGAISLVQTTAFETLVAPPGSENIATGGEERYIKNGGSDLADGLGDTTAWATLAKCTGSLPAGTDCNLKVGSTFTDRLSLAHAGTAGDRVDVTGYKMVSSVAKVAESGDALPIIDGTLTTACLTAGTCAYTDAGFSGDPTLGQYGGMVSLSATADYTTLRWLAIQQSRARGISATGTGTGSLTNLRVEHVTITDTGFEGMVFESGVRNLVVSDVNLLRINACESQRYQTGTSNTTLCNDAGWAADVQNTRNPNMYALYHDVEVVGGFGESMNFWNNDGAYSIVSKFRSSNGLSRCVTADTTSDVVIEGAICMGQPDSPSIGWYPGEAGRWGNNVIMSYEDFMLPDSTQPSIVVRNSMIIRTGIGIQCYIESAAISAGRGCSLRAYGNLVIGSESNALWTESKTNVWDVQNNVFWEEGLSAGDICGMSGTLNGVTMVDNHWQTNPSDSDCDGSGDTYGTPGLTATKTYSQWRTWTAGTFPAFVADATPQGGSALLNSGTDLSTGTDILVSADYSTAFDELQTIEGVTSELWQEKNAYTATYSTRDGTPNKGPVE
jgi:hypothetical protein